MIRLEKVCHLYPGPRGQKILALENVNLKIKQGCLTAIIGPNNSGKSTLGQICSGLLSPSSGQVYLEEKDLAQWDPTLLHKTIGLIFPHPDDQIIFPTVEDDLIFGLESLSLDSHQIKKKVDDILCFLGMEKYRLSSIHHLSGGQKQKIAIAAMVIRGLKYLILDEPISFLDAAAKREVLSLIQHIRLAGTTIIYLARVFEELTIADWIVILDGGMVEWQGTLLELLQKSCEMPHWGIEIPPIVKLVNTLREFGVELIHPIYTVKQLLLALENIQHEN